MPRERVEGLRAAYSEQENGKRGFVISGEDDLLAPYTDGRRAANRVVRSLRGVSGDIKEIGVPVDRVVASTERWRTRAAAPEIQLVRYGDCEAAVESIATGDGAARFDQVRANLDALDRRMAAVSATSDDRASSTRRQLTFLVVLFIVLLLVGTLVAAWLIRRSVTRPIDHFISDVRPIRSGGVDHRGAAPSGQSVAAGDCYGLVRLHDGAIGLIVVDIAGHGATEGILALRCKELLRASAGVHWLREC